MQKVVRSFQSLHNRRRLVLMRDEAPKRTRVERNACLARTCWSWRRLPRRVPSHSAISAFIVLLRMEQCDSVPSRNLCSRSRYRSKISIALGKSRWEWASMPRSILRLTRSMLTKERGRTASSAEKILPEAFCPLEDSHLRHRPRNLPSSQRIT